MPQPLLGVNFSHHQAEWLGLDADETFSLLLNDLRVRHFRLSLYWDEIQPEPTRYDLGQTHRYLDWAEARGAHVLLTVGLKAQRHPEFYPPAWLLGEGSPPHGGRVAEQPRLVAHLLLMLERAVALLADYGAIDAWQVENEPFLPAAGRTVGWRFDEATLRKEIAAVEGSDPRRRPIVINHSSHTIFERGWLRALRLGDVVAQDVYTRIPSGGPLRYWNRYTLGPFGPNLFVQSVLAHRFGRQFWINELQAEPWERTPLVDLAPEQIGSVSPQIIERNLALARRARPDRIYLWGAEWWRYMALRRDDRYWQLARGLFQGNA
ncbi:MAG TPA: hypothetical protein VKV26_25455 [Dehalococcoidia bacterium]|nr:hypothetical protein [Dehalococcoidia bacterium]